jgi:hypothetical protein
MQCTIHACAGPIRSGLCPCTRASTHQGEVPSPGDRPAAAGRPRLLLHPAALAQRTLYLGEFRHRHSPLDAGNVLLLSGQHSTLAFIWLRTVTRHVTDTAAQLAWAASWSHVRPVTAAACTCRTRCKLIHPTQHKPFPLRCCCGCRCRSWLWGFAKAAMFRGITSPEELQAKLAEAEGLGAKWVGVGGTVCLRRRVGGPNQAA